MASSFARSICRMAYRSALLPFSSTLSLTPNSGSVRMEKITSSGTSFWTNWHAVDVSPGAHVRDNLDIHETSEHRLERVDRPDQILFPPLGPEVAAFCRSLHDIARLPAGGGELQRGVAPRVIRCCFPARSRPLGLVPPSPSTR